MAVESNLRLSAQRAFLGRIHCEMRLIKAKIVGGEIVISIIIDKEPSESVREDVSIAAAEIIADFPDIRRIVENFRVSTSVIGSEDVLQEGWIYRRAE